MSDLLQDAYDELSKLREENRRFTSADPDEFLTDELAELRAENERLKAIVDKWPRTEDGIPVTDGMVTWCAGRRPFPHEWHLRDRHGERYDNHIATDHKHYSTRKAAEAAK